MVRTETFRYVFVFKISMNVASVWVLYRNSMHTEPLIKLAWSFLVGEIRKQLGCVRGYPDSFRTRIIEAAGHKTTAFTTILVVPSDLTSYCAYNPPPRPPVERCVLAVHMLGMTYAEAVCLRINCYRVQRPSVYLFK